LDRFYTPRISSIEGSQPRIFLDIENVSTLQKEWPLIEVGGKYIRRIRSSVDRKSRKARVVLDLEPLKDYFIHQNFARQENIYYLQVSTDTAK